MRHLRPGFALKKREVMGISTGERLRKLKEGRSSKLSGVFFKVSPGRGKMELMGGR